MQSIPSCRQARFTCEAYFKNPARDGIHEKSTPKRAFSEKRGRYAVRGDVVRAWGFEPQRTRHRNLNPACLPIPSCPRVVYFIIAAFRCQRGKSRAGLGGGGAARDGWGCFTTLFGCPRCRRPYRIPARLRTGGRFRYKPRCRGPVPGCHRRSTGRRRRFPVPPGSCGLPEGPG